MGRRALVIAPHADDEVLGLGGTIARYARDGYEVTVAILTGHGDDQPHPLWPRDVWETVRSEALEAHRVLGVHQTIFREIPAVTVADQPVWQLNRITHDVIEQVRPELLFVPFPLDLHKDHRELFHSLSPTWRPHTELGRTIHEIHCYEVPSETHLNIPYVEQSFTPQLWVDISQTLPLKLQALGCYRSQLHPWPHLRSERAVEALARWRGAQMATEAAEAFVTVRRHV